MLAIMKSRKRGLAPVLIFACVSLNLLAPGFAKQLSNSDPRPPVYDEVIDGKHFVVSKILVRAHAEQIWAILANYNDAANYFSILKRCKLLQDKGTTKIVLHELAPSGIPDTFEYVVEIKECPPKTMEWHRLSGDFKEVDGFWKLEPLDAGRYTMVTYASHVNGGFFMPQPLIKHQIQVDMPGVMLSLKNHAERPTEIASRRILNYGTQ